MSSFISRQFSGFVVDSVQTNASASQSYIWQMTDKPLKYILKLADGKVQHTSFTIATMGTFSIPLPNKYDVLKPLFALILTDTTIKVATVFAAPISQTSTILIKAGGNQQGQASWLGQTTSITLTNPQAGTATIEYLLYEQPDITQASAFRIGSQATGVSGSSVDATPGWV